MTKYRDLTIMPLSNEENLIIACDTSAAIGEKEHDVVTISPEIVAGFCLRVPLMEILAIGGTPIAIFNLVGNEWDQTGKRFMTGIQSELKKAKLLEVPINGSTEENMVTTMSSLGITVIAKVASSKMKFGCLSTGDAIFQLGTPFVGEEVVTNLASIFAYDELRELLAQPFVKEVLPVGSHGVLYEANLLAESSQLLFVLNSSRIEDITLKKSAGPATVLLIGVAAVDESKLVACFPKLKKVGNVKEIGYG